MSDRGAIHLISAMGLEDAYRSFGPDLVRFATVLVGRDDAADVVSSALVRLLDGKRESVRDYRAYLFQVVVNEARNWNRGEARRRMRENKYSSTSDLAYPTEPYPEVRNAVERLSVRQRAVVYLTYWEDLSDAVVADHLGMSAGAVRRHLARARSKLRGALDENS